MIRMLTQTTDDARSAKCVYVAPTKVGLSLSSDLECELIGDSGTMR